jgi:hypothetical protein
MNAHSGRHPAPGRSKLRTSHVFLLQTGGLLFKLHVQLLQLKELQPVPPDLVHVALPALHPQQSVQLDNSGPGSIPSARGHAQNDSCLKQSEDGTAGKGDELK